MLPFSPHKGVDIAAEHILQLPAFSRATEIEAMGLTPALQTAIELSRRMVWAFGARNPFAETLKLASSLTAATMPALWRAIEPVKAR